MADLPLVSPSVVQADQQEHHTSSHLRLDLPATGSPPPFGELFVRIYEHLEELRKNGYDEEADKMDNSRDVTVLIEIAEDRTWRKINEIWSARDFREALYHAIAPKVGGPLWLRQAFSITVAEEMCMRRIPNVSFSY